MLEILNTLKSFQVYFWAGLIAILALFGAYKLGSHDKQVEWNTSEKVKAQHAKDIGIAQNTVSAEVKTEYVNLIRQIMVEGETKIKQVPIYVPIQADTQCIIPNGFVSLWNATNRGDSLSDSPDRTFSETSGVKLSDVEAQHIAESEYTKGLEVQVNKWIAWYEKQQKVTK